MEARAVNNAGVGEVEVFQVAPIPGVTVRTARLNPGTIGEAVCREGGGLPEFAPSPNRGGIRQGRSPGFGRILHKIVWREELASVAGEEVECQDAIGADDTVGLIEPEAECISTRDDCAVGEGESHHESGEASTDSAETPGGLGD